MAEEKYLNAKQFCEVMLDKKRRLPMEPIFSTREDEEKTRIYAWFELIRSCNQYSHFVILTRGTKIPEGIESMQVTEAELLSLLVEWEKWKRNQKPVKYK